MTTAYNMGNVPPIEVRHRLRIAREYAGLEQNELAELIGVSRNTVGNAESGRGKPRQITLNAWALVTGVPVTWLMTGRAPQDGGNGTGIGLLLPRLDSNQEPPDFKAAKLCPAYTDRHAA